jgi:hypothetical protein
MPSDGSFYKVKDRRFEVCHRCFVKSRHCVNCGSAYSMRGMTTTTRCDTCDVNFCTSRANGCGFWRDSVGGLTTGFCSERCRQAACDAAPSGYAAAAAVLTVARPAAAAAADANSTP